MTDEQINAEIAAACILNLEKLTFEECEVFSWDIPNYCKCLNAMHAAEKVLNFVKFQNYIIYLMEHYPERAVTTARQRAEAFLRTLGKWKEAK